MSITSATLLERLRQPGDQQAWSRFVEIYTPLLFHWAGRLGLPPHDRDDLVQDVLRVLVEKLPTFAYDPQQSFRAWLAAILRNRHSNLRRRRAPVSLGPDHEPSEPDVLEVLAEAEHNAMLARRALELIRNAFEEPTWRAFWARRVEGRPAAEVAAELGMSTAAVHTNTSRVLARLRQELAGLLE